jgi:hypothetical protein
MGISRSTELMMGLGCENRYYLPNSVSVMAISDIRLKNLVALCGSADQLKARLEASYRQHPEKPKEWHVVQLEQRLRPKTASAVAPSTLEHLRKVMPSQPEAWYQRIAQSIHDGLMEMPALNGERPAVEWKVSGARASEFDLGATEKPKLAPLNLPSNPKASASQAIQKELIRLCHGDRAMAERLVKHELRRSPNSSDSVAWQRAIDSLLRDRQSLYSDGLYR